MKSPDPASPLVVTYEQIIDRVVETFRTKRMLPPGPPTPWDSFLRLSTAVHAQFVVPSTTFTPTMRRLLYALGFAARPMRLVGVGTYVCYTLAWLLRDRNDLEAAPFFESAVAIDTDVEANRTARRNCTILGHGRRLSIIDDDGVATLRKRDEPIDLIYVDLDDPLSGKTAYQVVIDAALPRLVPGALVLAHDACVPRFAHDFERYHSWLSVSGAFDDPIILRVDPCGLSVAVRR